MFTKTYPNHRIDGYAEKDVKKCESKVKKTFHIKKFSQKLTQRSYQ